MNILIIKILQFVNPSGGKFNEFSGLTHLKLPGKSIIKPQVGDTITPAQDSIPLIEKNHRFLWRDEMVEKDDSIAGRFVTAGREDPVRFNPQPISQAVSEWQVFTLSFSVLIIAFVRISQKHFFRNMYSGLISRPMFRQLLRDGQLIAASGKIPLLFAFLLVVTVFIFQLNSRFPFISFPDQTSIWMNALIIFLLLGIFEVLRFVLIQISGFIFKTREIVREYTTNNIFFHTLSTLLVLPLLIISIYAQTDLILFVASGILVITLLVRLMRGMLIALEVRSYSGLQIFLYLCALEILPVFILVKVLTGYISRI